MDLIELLRQPTILENLCLHLTFEDAVELLNIYGLSSLNCRVPIIDPDDRISFFDRVDPVTIATYSLIQKFGSNKALAEAFAKNLIEIVRTLLAARVYDSLELGRPLLIASEKGYSEIVKLLLDQEKIDVNVVDSFGEPSLIKASEHGHLEIVKLLLQNNAKVDQINDDEQSALLLAAKRGHPEIVNLLLAAGADNSVVDQNGMTALEWAVYKNHKEIVKTLLDHKSKQDQLTAQDISELLIIAAGKDNLNMLKFLFEYINNLKDMTIADVINTPDDSGNTAIINAVANDSISAAELLYQNGANINLINQTGGTDLSTASMYEDLKLVKFLLDHGAKVNGADVLGMTALHFAVQAKNLEIVKLLLGAGADVNTLAHDTWTPLDLAGNNPEMVELLTSFGALESHQI